MSWKFQDNIPIYLQLVDKIKLEIALGKLSPGQRIVSVRELATLSGVNPNTVQRALSVLENEALVTSSRTTGRFVTEDIEKIDNMRFLMSDTVILNFVNSMLEMGFDKTELPGLVDSYINKH